MQDSVCLKNIYEQTLEGLHDPYTAGACILTETAGNTFFRVGNIFVANLRRYFAAGDGVCWTHGFTEVAIPAFTAGKTAVSFSFNIGTAFNLRQVMLCGQCFKVNQFLVKRHPFFALGLRYNKVC